MTWFENYLGFALSCIFSLTFVSVAAFAGCHLRQRSWSWLSRICRRRRHWPMTLTPKFRRVSRARRGRASESRRNARNNNKNLSPITESVNWTPSSLYSSPFTAASCCSARNSLSSSSIMPSNHYAALRPASPPRKPCWMPKWPLPPPRPHPRLLLHCRTRTTLALSDPL